MGDSRLFAPLVRIVCARHGLACRGMDPGFPGTSAVFKVSTGGEGRPFYVKFFPPIVKGDFSRELAVLRIASRMEAFPAPRLLGHGIVEHGTRWPYLVLEGVKGSAVREAWRMMSGRERTRIARQAGAGLRRFNGVRLPIGEAVRAGFTPWKEFLRLRRARCMLELRRAGFASRSFLTSARAQVRKISPLARPVLINGDLTEDHVLAARSRGRWRIAGIIDFADALTGDPFYELAPVWFGMLGRRPELLRVFLASFMPHVRVGPAWRDRAAAFTLIHLFGVRMITTMLRKDGLRAGDFRKWEQFRDWLWPGILDQRGRKRK